ncbi:sensor histidine kinase [Roseococcus sp. DSY-14]|uniref:sensor histidine kinase n=1 Tax=Roseococcus sp. DSY-14 TaxID=3369650 RepID=UPI00387B79F4
MLQTLAEVALRPRRAAFRWGFATAAFVLALGLRLWLDPVLPPGFPFLTFFPAVILTAFLCGVKAGSAVAVASFLAAWWFFIPPFASFTFTAASLVALGFFAAIAAVDILLIHVMTRALERVQEERERNRRLAESRQALFTEMQHRVSNNLLTMASLLAIQTRGVTDPAARRALEEAQRRLQLVSRIHRQLHDPDLAAVEMPPFLHALTADVLEAAGAAEVRWEVRAAPLSLPAERAIPLALVTAELVANALEHGFAGGGRPGTLLVALEAVAGRAELRVHDDGAGLPAGFRAEESRSLGLTVVRQLAAQLGGEFSLHDAAGTEARLRFPLAA